MHDEATQLWRQGDDHPVAAHPAVHLGDRAPDLANPPMDRDAVAELESARHLDPPAVGG